MRQDGGWSVKDPCTVSARDAPPPPPWWLGVRPQPSARSRRESGPGGYTVRIAGSGASQHAHRAGPASGTHFCAGCPSTAPRQVTGQGGRSEGRVTQVCTAATPPGPVSRASTPALPPTYSIAHEFLSCPERGVEGTQGLRVQRQSGHLLSGSPWKGMKRVHVCESVQISARAPSAPPPRKGTGPKAWAPPALPPVCPGAWGPWDPQPLIPAPSCRPSHLST